MNPYIYIHLCMVSIYFNFNKITIMSKQDPPDKKTPVSSKNKSTSMKEEKSKRTGEDSPSSQESAEFGIRKIAL